MIDRGYDVPTQHLTDETSAGVAQAFQFINGVLAVVFDTTMLGRDPPRVCLQQHIAGTQVGRNRVANAAHVHDSRVPHSRVHRLVAVPGKDQVCLALAEKNLVVGSALPRLKADAVVAPRASVDTEHPRPIGQCGVELDRQF
jgi:hypothetical protein